jgi:hypothetical protein
MRNTIWIGAAAATLIAGALWLAKRLLADVPRAGPSTNAATATSASASASASAPRVAGTSQPSYTLANGRKHADDSLCIVKAPPAPRIASEAVSSSPFVEVDPTPPPNPALIAARQRIEANLRSSADPYANAVAVWLAAPGDDDTDGRLAAERKLKLAALAANTRDPRIYALALRSCWRRTDDSCASLNARQWAALDPGNAMPWTLLMDEAAEREDPSGVHESMFHITKSTRIDEGDYTPVGAIIDAAGDDAANLAAAFTMSIDAIGIAAAQVGPFAVSACRYATPANANVWQQCAAMLDLLENHSDSPALRMIGASLDRRITGNAASGKRVEAQLDQMLAAFPVSATGCQDLYRKIDFLRRAAVVGPIAAMSETVH